MLFACSIRCDECESVDIWLYRGKSKSEVDKGPYRCEFCRNISAFAVKTSKVNPKWFGGPFNDRPYQYGWYSGPYEINLGLLDEADSYRRDGWHRGEVNPRYEDVYKEINDRRESDFDDGAAV